MDSFVKSKWFDFLVICIRISMIRMFLSYGWSKLTESQFGISPEVALTPIKDLTLFQIGWYLFDHQPFKFVIGISQIICALLLVFNRTVIVGALMFIVIAFNILIIDETIMPDQLRISFRERLLTYILMAFIILFHHRDRFLPGLKLIFGTYQSKFKVRFWWFLLIPFGLFFVDFLSVIIFLFPKLITDFDGTINNFEQFYEWIISFLK